MENHTVSLLRIKEDGSSSDWSVGGVEIDETDGLLERVCFEPDADQAEYLERLGLIFNPPNSPLIFNFRVDGGRRFVWYVGDSEGEWLDPDLLDEREFRSASEHAERAARRLMQRARLAMPILESGSHPRAGGVSPGG